MKVSGMIERLQKLNPEMQIGIECSESRMPLTIKDIEERERWQGFEPIYCIIPSDEFFNVIKPV
jgi:protein associated with RNAse G/E